MADQLDEIRIGPDGVEGIEPDAEETIEHSDGSTTVTRTFDRPISTGTFRIGPRSAR